MLAVVDREKALLLSVSEAAALLGIGERTAYALIERGEFPVPTVTVGKRLKVSRQAVERFVNGDDIKGARPPAARRPRSSS